MKIIAISGWKQNGKDTVANYLVEKKFFIRSAFADKLKDMVAEEYSVPREHMDNSEFKEKAIPNLPIITSDSFSKVIHDHMLGEFRTESGRNHKTANPSERLFWTPRALCILKGSVNRAVTSKYWVQRVINTIKTTRGLKTGFVISDLRYKSELKQLREAFGSDLITIRINRFDTCDSDDASERDLDNSKFDHVICNKGTLKELYQKLERLI